MTDQLPPENVRRALVAYQKAQGDDRAPLEPILWAERAGHVLILAQPDGAKDRLVIDEHGNASVAPKIDQKDPQAYESKMRSRLDQDLADLARDDEWRPRVRAVTAQLGTLTDTQERQLVRLSECMDDARGSGVAHLAKVGDPVFVLAGTKTRVALVYNFTKRGFLQVIHTTPSNPDRMYTKSLDPSDVYVLPGLTTPSYSEGDVEVERGDAYGSDDGLDVIMGRAVPTLGGFDDTTPEREQLAEQLLDDVEAAERGDDGTSTILGSLGVFVSQDEHYVARDGAFAKLVDYVSPGALDQDAAGTVEQQHAMSITELRAQLVGEGALDDSIAERVRLDQDAAARDDLRVIVQVDPASPGAEHLPRINGKPVAVTEQRLDDTGQPIGEPKTYHGKVEIGRDFGREVDQDAAARDELNAMVGAPGHWEGTYGITPPPTLSFTTRDPAEIDLDGLTVSDLQLRVRVLVEERDFLRDLVTRRLLQP